MVDIDVRNKDMLNLWFCNIHGVGSELRRKLLKRFGTILKVYEAPVKLVEEVVGSNNISAFLESKNLEYVREIDERLMERKISFIYPGHRDYPNKLLNIYDYPHCLYVRGELKNSVNESNCNIAMVGARTSTTYGREVAKNISRNLAKEGISIISGLARGIDSMAHKGALEVGGYTVAVLGCGINVTYPKENIDLLLEIEKYGAVISEYGLDVMPLPGLFPCRNRIISGLSDGVCVVEAKKKSGSLITVDFALEQGKQIYAVPGRLFDKNSEGTNNLIRQGAMCISGYEDILSDIKYEDYHQINMFETNEKIDDNSNESDNCNEDKNKNFLAPIEKMVYSCLSLEPTYIDEIINQSGIGITKTISTLYMLEEKGVVRQPLKGYYIVAI